MSAVEPKAVKPIGVESVRLWQYPDILPRRSRTETVSQGLKHNGNHWSCNCHFASLIRLWNSLILPRAFPVPPSKKFAGNLQGICRISMIQIAQSTPLQRFFPVFSLP